MSGEDLLRVTHALLCPETTLAAVRALKGRPERAAVEGLVELVYRHRTAREVRAAIGALEGSTSPIVDHARYVALDSPHPSVRLAAVEALRQRRPSHGAASLGRVLGEDASWPVRRAALQFLASEQGPERWRVLDG